MCKITSNAIYLITFLLNNYLHTWSTLCFLHLHMLRQCCLLRNY